MFAVTGVSHMNAIEFTVHTVLIELTIGDSAGDAAVDSSCHFRPSSFPIMSFSLKIIPRVLTNGSLSYKINL